MPAIRNPAPGATGNRAVFDFRGSQPIPQNNRTAQPASGLRLVGFKALTKGALRGFASVEVPGGLIIEDCLILVSNGKAWASLPSKPVLDREGRHVKPDGVKGQYAAILRWRDRELQDRWSAAVVEAVRRANPEALDDGDGR